ncbi:MAG TPA: NUDIX domain-containing protein [Candidatus Paceibacterota bacterium]|nr:NUDIX domain-containing protein [Candidatus Paceibacterota bacterium]
MKRFPGYRELSISTDVVVFTVHDDALNVLLIKRAKVPFKGAWALPGGFPRTGETLTGTVERVLREKSGVRGVYVEQLYTFDSSGRDPRGDIPSVAYVALVPVSRLKPRTSATLQSPTLFPASRPPKLAFDHKRIIGYALKRVRAKLGYTNAAYSLLPRTFTLTELQRVYEAVLGRKLDKRNFRKKFLSLGLIRSTGRTTKGGQRRPARLYAFVSKQPTELTKAL